MKKTLPIRFIAINFILTIVFVSAAAAQTRPTATPAKPTMPAPTSRPTAPTAPTAGKAKIVFINTAYFSDSKQGITRYANAIDGLNAEFKTSAAEMDSMGARVTALQTEIKTYQNKPATDAIKAKLEEYDKLSREYKYKLQDAESRYNRRREVLLAPIRRSIGDAIQEYARKNGYIVFDVTKMINSGLILGYDETADITKDFITQFNARPATTAATTQPK